MGAISGAFLSPVSNRFSVAFLAPFRTGGRLLGVVHLDISLVDTRWASLIDAHELLVTDHLHHRVVHLRRRR